jgi:hypothetical protein
LTSLTNTGSCLQLEKQQKKLESKGIMVDVSQLRVEWEAARNGGRGGNNEPIEEHEIDVVGDDEEEEDDEEAETEDELVKTAAAKESSEDNNTAALISSANAAAAATAHVLKLRNNFSIDNLLAVRFQSTLMKQEDGGVIRPEAP